MSLGIAAYIVHEIKERRKHDKGLKIRFSEQDTNNETKVTQNETDANLLNVLTTHRVATKTSKDLEASQIESK